jgi:class 3 adenylate cyclase
VGVGLSLADSGWRATHVLKERTYSRPDYERISSARSEGPLLMWGNPRWTQTTSSRRLSACLPVGAAAFMLTDVKGSTHVQKFAPGTMGAAIARHDDLLDEAVSRHGGVATSAIWQMF